MATRYFAAKNAAGAPVSGLAPAFNVWIYADGSDPTIVDSLAQPAVAEIGGSGFYAFSYEPGLDLCFQLDLDPGGASGLVNRFQEDVLSPDDEAITELRLATIWSAATKKWMRIRNPTFTAAGKLDTATLAFYGNEGDAAAETNPLLEVAIDADYDVGQLLTAFAGLESP